MQKPSSFFFSLKLKLPMILRIAVIAALALAIVLALFFGLRGCASGGETVTSGGTAMQGVSPGDSVRGFGNRIVSFTGSLVRCYSLSGDEEWQYSIPDSTGGYALQVSDKQLGVYSGRNLLFLDEKGVSNYSGLMDGDIESLRMGQARCAVQINGAKNILVLDKNGAMVDTIDLGEKQLLDYGFYSANDLLWVLTLDTSSLAFVSNLDIYQAGKEQVNGYTTESQVYYKPLFYKDYAYVLGTKAIDVMAPSQKDNASISVYGWQYMDAFGGSDAMNILLAQNVQGENPSTVRVVRGQAAEDLHLPQGTISASAGEKGIYAVTPQALYTIPYAAGKMESYAFRYTVDNVLCCVQGKYMVVSSGQAVYLVQLP